MAIFVVKYIIIQINGQVYGLINSDVALLPLFSTREFNLWNVSTDFVNDMSEKITHISLMGILALCKNRRNAKNTNTFFSTCSNNLCMLRLVVLRVSCKLSVCFCTGHCIMVSLHLSTLFATFFSELLSNLCYCSEAF